MRCLFALLLLPARPACFANPALLPKDVAEGLAAAPLVTLYSLQPRGGPDLPEWNFHGHHQLGHVDLTPEQGKKAVAALQEAIASGEAGVYSNCIFEPRHALRFKCDGHVFDIVICYHCGQLELYKDDVSLPFGGRIGGKPDVLNGMLGDAHITLADSPAALYDSYTEEANTALQRAKGGDVEAQQVIAKLLLKGRGVKTDEAEGGQWLAKSLHLTPESPEFEVILGKIYENGFEVAKNEAVALSLYRKAAAQGSARAMYQLGFAFEYGVGVPKSTGKATKLYQKAAESGDAEGEYELGVRYAQGRDVKKDNLKALKWLRKAADQGLSGALYWMGGMYEDGRGVPKDQIEAYFWDRLAEAHGTCYGPRVSVTLTPEQSATMEKRIADWMAAHPQRADE